MYKNRKSKNRKDCALLASEVFSHRVLPDSVSGDHEIFILKRCLKGKHG